MILSGENKIDPWQPFKIVHSGFSHSITIKKVKSDPKKLYHTFKLFKFFLTFFLPNQQSLSIQIYTFSQKKA